MDASSLPSDAERELVELRKRAYGPHPDIQDDPVALARLTELEAARTTSPPGGADTEISEAGAAAIEPVMESSEGSRRSLWHRLTATRARRISFVAGALVAILALGYAVVWLVAPHPDATLRQTADEADGAVLSVLDFLEADVDPSSIRGFQPYRGLEPWFAVDSQGFQCFMLIERRGPTVDGANCVPPGVDLFAEIGTLPQLGDDFPDGLPEGSLIRFHYRGDSVDVFIYPASEAE